jgi:hypothetical protein
MPVSSDNPYVGPNLFLAKEMEGSTYLYSFMKGRGAPRAIELSGESEQSAEMNLYYSAKGEVFRASPRQDPNSTIKEWIIRGPYAIGRDNYNSMRQLGPETGGVFEIFGRREVLGGPARAAQTRVIVPVFIPTPTPQPVKIGRKAKIVKSAITPAPQVTLQTTPSNFDQEVLFEARKRALATPQATPILVKDASPATPSPLDDALKNSILKSSPIPSASKDTTTIERVPSTSESAHKEVADSQGKVIADLATTMTPAPPKGQHR